MILGTVPNTGEEEHGLSSQHRRTCDVSYRMPVRDGGQYRVLQRASAICMRWESARRVTDLLLTFLYTGYKSALACWTIWMTECLMMGYDRETVDGRERCRVRGER